MAETSERIAVTTLDQIGGIAASAWDGCAGTDNPFVSHAFLSALEDSGSACSETGWTPRHLTILDKDGGLAAAMPLYVKSHSYGEYVFDHAWADAFERAGGRYYPKLQSAVPFTPVSGPRLLVRAGLERAPLEGALIGALLRLTESHNLSSAHITFCRQDEAQQFEKYGFLLRTGLQFHWRNRGYASFDEFLDDLTSRKRKAIRKERAVVAASGVVIAGLSGSEIEARHWDAFYHFYLHTSRAKWGHPYLTRDFFTRLGATLGDRVLLVLAEKDGEPVAGALNLIGDDCLYGRNWGCGAEFKFLHFEACYYQAIDFAIQRGLARVEAGAQGPHKVQRGYMAKPTYSAHWIADTGFREAVARYLVQERGEIDRQIEVFTTLSPYRQGST